jgi:hypothetical protein
VKCTSCGATYDPTHTNPDSTHGRFMGAKKVCFGCAFWSDKLNIADHSRVARIDGTHYFYEDDKDGGFKGFGGRKFEIKFHDGRTVVTRNLWCQGNIPAHFRDRLPDNAEFLS